MFETTVTKPAFKLWKILPVAVVIFALIIAVIVSLSRTEQPVAEQLTGVLHRGDPDFDWYRKYVELREPRIQMARNLAGHRMVTLSGIVTNNGEKRLDVVELQLQFFNGDQLVYEMIRTPFRPGPRNHPIEPLGEQGFAFYVEPIPENWTANNAEMSVHGFRFE